jgi:hypothetical protein
MVPAPPYVQAPAFQPRSMGEYKDTCWYIGYIDDAEFGIRREYYADTCDKEAEHASWQRQHGFETQWDLGVQ